MSGYAVSTYFMYRSEKTHKKNTRIILVVLAFLIPSVIAAFRESGVDYPAYKEIYNAISSNNGGDYIEIGWYYLNKVSPSFEFLLFVSANLFLLFMYLGAYSFGRRDKWIAWFIILVVFFGTFFNGMRQMLSAAICFFAISKFLKKRYIKFYLFIALACLFHKSALFVILYPIMHGVFKSRIGILWITMISLLIIIMQSFIVWIIGNFTSYGGYLNRVDGINISFKFLLYLIPPILLYFNRYKRFRTDKQLRYLINVYLFCIPMQILGFYVAYADRLMWYFQPMIIAIVPMVVHKYDMFFKKNHTRPLYVLWFSFHFIIMEMFLNGSKVFPYRNSF